MERSFGVLQSRWAIVRHPVGGWIIETLGEVMNAYVIIYNMIVLDEHDASIFDQGCSKQTSYYFLQQIPKKHHNEPNRLRNAQFMLLHTITMKS